MYCPICGGDLDYLCSVGAYVCDVCCTAFIIERFNVSIDKLRKVDEE